MNNVSNTNKLRKRKIIKKHAYDVIESIAKRNGITINEVFKLAKVNQINKFKKTINSKDRDLLKISYLLNANPDFIAGKSDVFERNYFNEQELYLFLGIDSGITAPFKKTGKGKYTKNSLDRILNLSYAKGLTVKEVFDRAKVKIENYKKFTKKIDEHDKDILSLSFVLDVNPRFLSMKAKGRQRTKYDDIELQNSDDSLEVITKENIKKGKHLKIPLDTIENFSNKKGMSIQEVFKKAGVIDKNKFYKEVSSDDPDVMSLAYILNISPEYIALKKTRPYRTLKEKNNFISKYGEKNHYIKEIKNENPAMKDAMIKENNKTGPKQKSPINIIESIANKKGMTIEEAFKKAHVENTEKFYSKLSSDDPDVATISYILGVHPKYIVRESTNQARTKKIDLEFFNTRGKEFNMKVDKNELLKKQRPSETPLKRLEKSLIKSNLTSKELFKKTNFKYSMAFWRKEKINANNYEVLKIAKALNVNPEWLVAQSRLSKRRLYDEKMLEAKSREKEIETKQAKKSPNKDRNKNYTVIDIEDVQETPIENKKSFDKGVFADEKQTFTLNEVLEIENQSKPKGFFSRISETINSFFTK